MSTYNEAKHISDFLRTKVKDKIQIRDFGATVLPKNKELSKGCLSCKSGAWICIYIGVSCNLKCISCPQISRHSEPESIWANGGNDDIHSLEDLRKTLDKNRRIHGLSFSGGEPFLYLDKIKEWLDFINTNYADLNLYLWLYTNGVKVTKENCEMLKENGIKEIRFDLAATDYSDKIIEKIKYCKDIFEKVSVEVPVEPWRLDKLIGSLKKLDEIGVDYLNLHELAVCDDNRQKLIDAGYIDPTLIYNAVTGNHYLPSIIDVYRVIEYIEDNNLNIIYNDCSARNMVLQTMGWQYQRNRQNPNFIWEEWENFCKRAVADGNAP
jgi:pyruvate formate-lyase activating enzyme-like uncharacterized protein